MKKSFYLLLLLFLFACGPAAKPAALSETPGDGTGAVEEQQDVPTEVAVEPTAVEIEPESEKADSTEDSAQESRPTDSTTDAAEANVVRDNDHVLGASEPLVTIIEYGDFQ